MKINGVTVPTPSSIEYQLEHIDQAERNANATMLIDGIAVKVKLGMAWNYLSPSDAKTIMENTAAVAKRIVLVEDYPSPLTGTFTSGYFYFGGKKAGVMHIRSGNTIGYENFTVNAIEA